MTKAVGIDIEEVKRFKRPKKAFLDLVFTKREIEYCKKKASVAQSLAGRFCAKEAVIKAHKKMNMKEIEIRSSKTGKLEVYIKGKKQKNILCSISHTKEYASAVAIKT